jgi:hypothetical protein
VYSPLLVVRYGSASLVVIRSVVEDPLDGVEAVTVAVGVPPTSRPKSSTIVAGAAAEVVRSVVEPVLWPVRAVALVTVPAVRVTATGRTLSLVGAGTRLCQSGLAGHVGGAACAGWADRIVVAVMAANAAAARRVRRWTARPGTG